MPVSSAKSLKRFAIFSFLQARCDHLCAVMRWTLLLIPLAMAIGTLCAAFLWSLETATQLRSNFAWLLFLLPVGGFIIGWLYHRIGHSVEAGNNLVLEQIHEPGGGLPFRMAPLVFVSTVATHLFGGSAGREGTAVQLGGGLASALGQLARLDAASMRIILMAGVAAGFGAVFGTPIAGAVFALEVITIGRVEYAALVPCLIASIVGDWTCHSWGIHHISYFIHEPLRSSANDPVLLIKAAIAGAIFGLASLLFAETSHVLGSLAKRWISYSPLRPAVGGIMIIGLVYLLGTRDYIGLGVWSPDPAAITIATFFRSDIHPWSWLLKLIFTVVTLSTGFKGGEVTPLFFIGAALGNALAGLLDAPVDLFAGLGFIAVFAGAANTPLACTLMGIELFGATHALPMATACFMAYLCSGHSGIYLSQRIGVPKVADARLSAQATLRDVRSRGARPISMGLHDTKEHPIDF